MSGLRWSHRLEYALFRGAEAAVSAVPQRMAGAFGAAVGVLAGSALRVRRATVEANLAAAFPAAPRPWIRAVARRSYAHLGREAIGLLRMSRWSTAEVERRTELPAWPEIRQAVEGGRGVLLVTGHFGNWELAASAVAARGLPIAVVVKRQRNRLFEARLEALRQRLGLRTIDFREAPRRVPRLLRDGMVVGVVADQDAGRAGLFVPFFGRLASTYRGPALFALRCDAAVFACTGRRIGNGEARYAIECTRLELPRTGDLEADTIALTAALAADLEVAVRRAPEQYFWFHRRWKTRAPTEPMPPAFGTRSAVGAVAQPEDEPLDLYLHPLVQRGQHGRRAALEDSAGDGPVPP